MTLLSANGLIQMYVVALDSLSRRTFYNNDVTNPQTLFGIRHPQIYKSIKQQIIKTSKIALIGIFITVLTFNF